MLRPANNEWWADGSKHKLGQPFHTTNVGDFLFIHNPKPIYMAIQSQDVAKRRQCFGKKWRRRPARASPSSRHKGWWFRGSYHNLCASRFLRNPSQTCLRYVTSTTMEHEITNSRMTESPIIIPLIPVFAKTNQHGISTSSDDSTENTKELICFRFTLLAFGIY